MKRVGILGGTFDPIHIGHLRMAETAQEVLSLDNILFIPASVSPFKMEVNCSSEKDRFEMIRLAIADTPYFELTAIELDRDPPSYTIETLREIKAITNYELYLLLGADSAEQIALWKEPEALFELATIAAFTRLGYDDNKLDKRIVRIPMNPPLAVSSTLIRNLCSEGKSIRYLTPDAIVRYIENHKLYIDGGETY